jgi:hypothetical protein
LQDEEVAMLTEMSHLQEAVQQLEKHTADPHTLPPASEQVIADLKSSDGGWSFRTPPSSPSSLGSRKSSMCSISSLNSSSSGSSKSHHSPSHPHWQRSLSQVVRVVLCGFRFFFIFSLFLFYFGHRTWVVAVLSDTCQFLARILDLRPKILCIPDLRRLSV